MNIPNIYTDRIYIGGNRNVCRIIKDIKYINNRWTIIYRNCGYTDKQGWFEFGETKKCSRKTFNAWVKDEIK